MTAEESNTQSQNWLVCPVCSHINPIPSRYCYHCWARLDKATPISAETATRLAKVRRSKQRRNRLLLILVPLFVVLVAAGLFSYLGWGSLNRLPPVSTNISATSGPGEWTMWRHDPAHTGYAPQDGARPQGIVEWQFATGEPLLSSPAVAGGTLYLATGDNRLIALDAESGQVKWESGTTGPVNSSPAVAGGLVYIGLRDARLIALDASNGILRWQLKLGGPILSSPTVSNGMVYVSCLNDQLYAMDAANGELRWTADTKNLMASSSPAVSQRIVVVGSRMRGETHLVGARGGSVYFVDAMSGRIQLEYHTPRQLDSSPTIRDGVVYIGGQDQRLYALSLTARPWPLEWPILKIWANLYLWGIAPPPPNQSGFLWTFQADGEVNTGPAVAQGMVYFGTDSGTFYALDITGQEQWHFVTSKPLSSSPAVGNGVVYFGCSDGKLYALDAVSGDKLWDFTTGGEISASPTLAQGMVFVASGDGRLYALK